MLILCQGGFKEQIDIRSEFAKFRIYVTSALPVWELSASQSTWCVQVLRFPEEAFAAAMQSWRERCEKCVCLQGDYVEKLLHFQLPVVSSFF